MKFSICPKFYTSHTSKLSLWSSSRSMLYLSVSPRNDEILLNSGLIGSLSTIEVRLLTWKWTIWIWSYWVDSYINQRVYYRSELLRGLSIRISDVSRTFALSDSIKDLFEGAYRKREFRDYSKSFVHNMVVKSIRTVKLLWINMPIIKKYLTTGIPKRWNLVRVVAY